MTDQRHQFNANMERSEYGPITVVTARCSCGWLQRTTGHWVIAADARRDAQKLHWAHESQQETGS